MASSYGTSAKDFVKSVKEGSADVKEFHEKFLERARKLDKQYNFFLTIAEKLEAHKKGRLYPIPVSVKDCICTRGMQTTAGSRILEGYVPVFDATCVEAIKNEGGAVVGKTQQDEFGFGTFSVNSGYEIPKNPHDPDRSCGGSSGGAAGFTAAIGMPHIALAESTGGSISCPGSFCGVIGLTPTYGLVSRYGLIDYANSLDKIGCMATSVEDIALLLSVMAGKDEKDPTSSLSKKEDYGKLEGRLKGLKIAVPKEYFRIDKKISKHIWDSIRLLEKEGARYDEISLPSTGLGLASYYIIATSEASTNLAKYCGMRYGKQDAMEGDYNEYFSSIRGKYLGREAKRRILLGTFSRMAGYKDKYYIRALQARGVIIDEFNKAFSKHDIIIAPTMPIIAPKFSEIEKLSPVDHYKMDILTVCPNLAGIPHISLPCGKEKGMPVGMHMMAGHFKEKKLLDAAYGFERLHS
ncbi:MAG: Asp-tRNA(Asn)/Glu-tRNA(Gln) amidotransferase subunit GatA [Candidatus Aenigmarchaeota archaeon]|nr:Asp-tRNA(Asn)/Glu-tRNA(Gln) amidotransferase subunit GatA [Candidatus Aenigmarchaeota archaeon]